MISKTDYIVKISKLRTVMVVYETKVTNGTEETMQTERKQTKFLYMVKQKVSRIKWGIWSSYNCV